MKLLIITATLCTTTIAAQAESLTEIAYAVGYIVRSRAICGAPPLSEFIIAEKRYTKEELTPFVKNVEEGLSAADASFSGLGKEAFCRHLREQDKKLAQQPVKPSIQFVSPAPKPAPANAVNNADIVPSVFGAAYVIEAHNICMSKRHVGKDNLTSMMKQESTLESTVAGIQSAIDDASKESFAIFCLKFP